MAGSLKKVTSSFTKSDPPSNQSEDTDKKKSNILQIKDEKDKRK